MQEYVFSLNCFPCDRTGICVGVCLNSISCDRIGICVGVCLNSIPCDRTGICVGVCLNSISCDQRGKYKVYQHTPAAPVVAVISTGSDIGNTEEEEWCLPSYFPL